MNVHKINHSNVLENSEALEDVDSDMGPPPKRKRIRQKASCTQCQKRKAKCNREDPCEAVRLTPTHIFSLLNLMSSRYSASVSDLSMRVVVLCFTCLK